MKKHLGQFTLLLLIFIITLPGITFAGVQHSLSVDMIRMVDKAQYDGLFNIYYQCSLNKQTAVVAGISMDNDYSIAEFSLKYYLEKYFEGPFVQAGINIGDYDKDSEIGLSAAIGYEKSIARHIVISGAVEMLAGTMDNYVTGNNEPMFRPILSIMFAF